MEYFGFFHDTARCVDCKACQVACKEKNKLSAGEFFRRAQTIPLKKADGVSYVRFSGGCNHCAEPSCVSVCPTGAMYIAPDGTVQHKDALCIGCGRCVHQCPYGAVSLNKYTGYAQKCDACADRRAEGRAPVCVEACPMEALHFGPLSLLRQRFGEALGASVPYLPSEELTKPSLLVRGGAKCAEAPFKKAAVASPPMERAELCAKILILGSGPAAAAAACELRRRSSTVKIALISREKHLPYSRPMLSKALTSSFAEDRYNILEENRLAEDNVDFIGGVEITAIEPDNHTVILGDGRALSYDKCIYALGADCFRPDIKGSDLAGVYTLRSVSDLTALRCEMLTAKRVVIVGGGITGSELAWELKRSGLDVVLAEPLPQLMDRFLDPRSAACLQDSFSACGIQCHLGTAIRAIEGAHHVSAVSLADGTEIPADLVILAAGYRANVSLAAKAGMAADTLIHVTPRMETSEKDIYACGDCTDLSGATWLQSVRQGRIVAANALGADESFVPEQEPSIVQTADTSLLVIGDMGKKPDREYRFLYGEEYSEGEFFRVNPLSNARKLTHYSFSFADNRLVGAVMVGNLSAMQLVEEAVREAWSPEKLRGTFSARGVELHEE